MSRVKRYIVLGLVVVLVFAAVTGIAVWTASVDPDQKAPGLYQNGKRVSDPAPAMQIGEHEVSFGDYRHYFLVLRSSFETWYGGDTMWDEDPDGEKAYILRNAVETDIVNMYAWLDIADEYGITLSDEDEAEIQQNLADQKEEYGAAFEEQLADMYFESEEDYLRITRLQKLSEKAQTEYGEMMQEQVAATAGADADADYKANNITAKHILIAFDEENEDTEQAKADALAEAEDILAQINASDDPAATFDELMWEHTDDKAGLEANPDGYTFKEGDMVAEFYEGALALDEYEISEPIESSYGYHIIMRLPLDESGMEANRESAASAEATALKDKKAEEVKATYTITYADYYDDIGPRDIQ